MGCAWLLKRFVYLALLLAGPLLAVPVLVRDWSRIAAFMNGPWPQWVGNLANVVQIGSPAIAFLAVWLARAARSRRAEPGAGAAGRLLGILSLLLPVRDRER